MKQQIRLGLQMMGQGYYSTGRIFNNDQNDDIEAESKIKR